MKKFWSLMIALGITSGATLQAHEGMWLPMLIKRLNYEDMKAHGLQLTAEELYSVNNSSLKDAIVSLGGFCTGELISPDGLMLTNHHCGFSSIQSHSTVENDYLTDGFWAMDRSKELPNEGLYARFLVRMEDVTEQVLAELSDDMSEADRQKKAAEVGKKLAAEATKDSYYDAEVKGFFHGNEYYLFVYETYRDVRLVGAPPSSIGKYGGDTDNWMWPRHTGDFSMFRVYMSPDGKPAEYSEDNVPMKSKHFLPVSLDGVQEGDFTMIFGYPGSTDRYLSSFGVSQAIDKYNPTVVKIRDLKLEIMKEQMDIDPEVRIKLAAKYAQTSNYWKYYIGQTEQLKRNRVLQKKQKTEKEFLDWVNADPARQEKYGETLDLLKKAYASTDATVKGDVYLFEAGLIGPMSPLFAFRMDRLMGRYFSMEDELDKQLKEADSKEKKEELKKNFEEKRAAILEQVRGMAEDHFKDYDETTEKKLIANLWQLYYDNVPVDQQPEFFRYIEKKFKGDVSKYTDKVFDKSIMVNKERFMAFLEDPDDDDFEDDLMRQAGADLIAMYFGREARNAEASEMMDKGYRLWTAGIREMKPDHKFSPDANSTMRMTWGEVGSYMPQDAVFYDYYTTLEGVMQKEDPSNPEFIVPERLKELYNKKDYGQYADKNGELPVCFISDNDITGGNSGSPVINGRGELIGCAFDGNWEAMSGDIAFEDQLQRTISVDIRYVLFIIDKYAGASHLIDEMNLVTSAKEVKEEAQPEKTEASKM
ncbi:MAG: S46 family peptidase [Bacteroidota bacterium]|nr:S46 family peptidase [Bacteroidota bacterium]